MKVLLINGSPHREGNTFIALSEVARTLESEGVQAEIVHIGTKAVQGCIACGKCAELGHCVFSDALYTTVREKLADADGIVVGSPVYYAGPNGSLCALLDRRWRPKPRSGSGRILSGSGARPDAERRIECVADVYEGSLAPFFFVARTSSGVLPLYCPRIQRGAEKPEKISAGGAGFMEKNDNLPP